MPERAEMIAIAGIPDIAPGDDLAAILLDAMGREGIELADGDILAIAHKVFSKAEGRLVRLAEVEPSGEARELAGKVNKDPRKVEVVLSESSRILRAVRHAGHEEGIIIAEHRLGFQCANAGVDESNIEDEGVVAMLPADPDASARTLRDQLEEKTGARVGVVMTDTFGRPWRLGLVNVAIGLAGVPALIDLVGEDDAYGREMKVTRPALADEIAAASGLLMAKRGKLPAVLFRGLEWIETHSAASDLLRPRQEDLFQ